MSKNYKKEGDIMKYDDYYKTKSKMLLNVYKATLISLINHGVLQEDENIKSALDIINNEIENKRRERK